MGMLLYLGGAETVRGYSNNGQIGPLNGGKVYFYVAGTSTPQDTYTDSTGKTANANPVILDSAGRGFRSGVFRCRRQQGAADHAAFTR